MFSLFLNYDLANNKETISTWKYRSRWLLKAIKFMQAKKCWKGRQGLDKIHNPQKFLVCVLTPIIQNWLSLFCWSSRINPPIFFSLQNFLSKFLSNLFIPPKLGKFSISQCSSYWKMHFLVKKNWKKVFLHMPPQKHFPLGSYPQLPDRGKSHISHGSALTKKDCLISFFFSLT